MKSLPKIPFMLIGEDWSEEAVENTLFTQDVMRDYVMQPKVDDIRVQVHFLDGAVRLQTRNFIEKTANYPQFQKWYRASLEGTVLDGGLVAGLGWPVGSRECWKGSLPLMVSINGSSFGRAIFLQRNQGWAQFVIFDIVRYRGKDVTKEPLEKRMVLISNLRLPGLIIPETWTTDFSKRYSELVARGGEGVVLKLKGAPYEYGRSSNWIRVKHYEDLYCWLGGSPLPGAGKYSGMIGSLEVVNKEGKTLAYVSGMSDSTRRLLGKKGGGIRKEFIGRECIVRHNPRKSVSGDSMGLRHPRVVWIQGISD